MPGMFIAATASKTSRAGNREGKSIKKTTSRMVFFNTLLGVLLVIDVGLVANIALISQPGWHNLQDFCGDFYHIRFFHFAIKVLHIWHFATKMTHLQLFAIKKIYFGILQQKTYFQPFAIKTLYLGPIGNHKR